MAVLEPDTPGPVSLPCSTALVARKFRPVDGASAVSAAESFEPTGVMLDWKQVVTRAQSGWFDEANFTRSGGWYDEATMVNLDLRK